MLFCVHHAWDSSMWGRGRKLLVEGSLLMPTVVGYPPQSIHPSMLTDIGFNKRVAAFARMKIIHAKRVLKTMKLHRNRKKHHVKVSHVQFVVVTFD